MKKLILNLFLCLFVFGACNSSSKHNQSELSEASIASYDSLQITHDHDTIGKEIAKKQLQELLRGKGQPFTWDTLIKNSSTVIAMAEPLLFDIFGKYKTLSEKPYKVYLLDGYWYLSGTIPKGSKGGGFERIISAQDAKIIRLTHYK